MLMGIGAIGVNVLAGKNQPHRAGTVPFEHSQTPRTVHRPNPASWEDMARHTTMVQHSDWYRAPRML